MAVKKKKLPNKTIAKKTIKSDSKKVKAVAKKTKPAKKVVQEEASIYSRNKSSSSSQPSYALTFTKGSVTSYSMSQVKVGEVDDYYAKIHVISLPLRESISIGDTIKIKGHTTDFTQRVDSIQMNHKSIQKAKKGDEIGILVQGRCRPGDKVYRLM